MPQEPQAPFILSTEAAKRFNLTNDHIGLLCRRGKVQGKLLGRVWYVSEPSLAAYIEKTAQAQEARRKALASQWRTAWTAGLILILFFAYSNKYVEAEVSGMPLVNAQPTAITVSSLNEKMGEMMQSLPQVSLPTLTAPPAVQSAHATYRYEPSFISQVAAGVGVVGDAVAEVFLSPRAAPVHIVYAKDFVEEKEVATPAKSISNVLAAAVANADAYVKNIPVPAIQPAAQPGSEPFFSSVNILAGVQVANDFLNSVNDTMLAGYVQTGKQLASATTFDAQAASAIWDYTFGSFGEKFVRETYALNDLQTDLYMHAGSALVGAYDAPPLADSSLSVASVAAVAPGISVDHAIENSGLANVWDAVINFFGETFFTPESTGVATENTAPAKILSQNSSDGDAPAKFASENSSGRLIPQNLPVGFQNFPQQVSPVPVQPLPQLLTSNYVTQDSLNNQLGAWLLVVKALIAGNTGYVDNPAIAASGNVSGGTTVINNYGLSQRIDHLDGVTITNATITGSTFNGASSFSGGGGASALTDLSDTLVASPAYGNLLMYNGSKWINTATSSLGISSGTLIGSVGNWFTPSTFGTRSSNATSTLIGFTQGLYALASSTIGSGTEGGGLTVLGGATTTGNLHVLGTGTSTFVGNIGISGNIVPSADQIYSLGSAVYAWKDLFVGPGSIYVNGQEVLHTDPSHNVNVSADPNQSIIVQTSGTGDVQLNPTGTGIIYLKGNVLFSGGKTFNTSDNSATTFTDGVTGGNLKVSGNVITPTNLNGGISITPLGSGGTYFTSGNVGIGTTSPFAKLSVSGDAYISNNLTAAGAVVFSSLGNGVLFSTNGTISAVSTSSLGISGGGAANLYASTTIGTGAQNAGLTVSGGATTTGNVYIAGNLGIGTNAPTSKLTVAGDIVGTNITANGTATFGGSTFNIFSNGTLVAAPAASYGGTVFNFGNNAGNEVGAGAAYFVIQPASVNSNAYLLWAGVGISTKFDITGDGLVGIGTTSPLQVLSVQGSGLFSGNINAAGITATGTLKLLALTSQSCLGTDASGNVQAGTCSGGGNSFGYEFPNNATTTGLGIYASSTIGNGTQTGGLTVSGGATTTGNAYFVGGVNIGAFTSLNPIATLQVNTSVSKTVGGLDTTSNLGLFVFGNTVNVAENIQSGIRLGEGYSGLYSVDRGTSGNQGLGFFTGSSAAVSERLRIQETGNVGIGTTTPFAKLSINNSTNDATQPLFAVASSTAISTTTAFIIANNGNVGIGLNSPLTPLHIFTAGATGITIERGSIANSVIQYKNTSGSFYAGISVINANFGIGSLNDLTTASFQITQAGNVGIGTTSPYAVLSVVGASGVVAGKYTATSTATSTFAGAIKAACFSVDGNTCITSGGAANLYASTTIGDGTQTGGLTVSGGATTTGNLYVSGSVSSANSFHTSGGVYVGGSSGFMQWGDNGIAGSITGALGIVSDGVFRFLDSSGGGSPRIILGSSSAGWVSLKRNGASLDIRLGDDSGYASTTAAFFTANSTIRASTLPFASSTVISVTGSAYFATSAGNVGIGTTSPWAKLSINNSTNDAAGQALFVIASSTASATTTLFSISNTGFVTISSIFTASSTIGSTTLPVALEVQGDIVSKGTVWTTQTSAANNTWNSVTYGNGMFVAVASTGSGNRVATSPDGINWTTRTSAADNGWNSVTYGNGMFVAVANNGTIMTSSNGITWALRTSTANNNSWIAVTYGNGQFVAVSGGGETNAIMTSQDGINWTIRNAGSSNAWNTITYGNGLFVIMGLSGLIRTSPDGITWTVRTGVTTNTWKSVTYGNGLFVAVGISGTGTRVITSPDGINWAIRASTADNTWNSVTYGNGLFVAVSSTGSGNRVATSPDGINWTTRTSAADNTWNSVTYGNGMFVAVASTGSGNRVMTSGKPDYSSVSLNNIWQGVSAFMGGNFGIGTSSPFANFSLQAWAAASTTPVNNILFSVSSSTSFENGAATSSLFVITNTGNVGIGTTSPYARLSVMGEIVGANLTATSTTATSTFAGGLNVGSGALTYDFSSGVTSINNAALGSFTFDTDAGIVNWADLPISSNAATGTVESYTANIGGASLFTIYGEADGSGNAQNLRVGIGTTTPGIFGGNGAYLTIDRSSSNQYGLLSYASTTGSITQAAFANSNGIVGTISTNGSATAYNTSSDRRIKGDIATTSMGLSQLMQIPVRDFDFLNDPAHATTTGFIAQELFRVFPYAVTTNGDDGSGSLATGTLPWSVDYGRITPLLVKAVQDIASITSSFKDNLIAWLADSANGITKLFAKEVHTDKLCVGDTCVTQAQFMAMVAASGSQQVQAPVPQAPVVDPAPDASSTPDVPPTDEATSTSDIPPAPDVPSDASSTPQE